MQRMCFPEAKRFEALGQRDRGDGDAGCKRCALRPRGAHAYPSQSGRTRRLQATAGQRRLPPVPAAPEPQAFGLIGIDTIGRDDGMTNRSSLFADGRRLLTTLCFAQEALPMMKFASDEVAAAAKGAVAAEAIAARQKLDAAFAAQDVDAVSALCAKNVVVNTPWNRIARLEQVLGLFKAGRMNYESADETIEAVDVRGDHVVIMGEEVVKPRDTAANAGKTVRRRFTDVWRKESDGRWRVTIRQATITSVE